MKNLKYDAVIIGAGIGGLVCGGYLAKAGKKILIIEQNTNAGGYCVSFKRRGYIFDAAVHSLRGVRRQNQLGIIYHDLDLKKNLKFNRIDPSDIVIFGDTKVRIHNDLDETVESLKNAFPRQKNQVTDFFKFLIYSDFLKLYKLTKDKTFGQLLEEYFKDEKIKLWFNILLGNLGLDSKHISALSAIVFYNELFMDGGYYPVGGLQAFPDALCKTILEYGGNIIFKNKVKKILVQNDKVKGVMLENNSFFESSTVISNVDAKKTYFEMIEDNFLKKSFKRQLRLLHNSPSAFVVYLGLRNKMDNAEKCCTLWYFPTAKSTKCYNENFLNDQMSLIGKYAICGLSSVSLNSLDTITLTSIAPYKSRLYWNKRRNFLAEKVVDGASKIFPNLKENIDVIETATPHTLHRYTSNDRGAMYGWASMPNQINKFTVSQKGKIKGLYLCGHWATRGWGQGGISMVANSGRTTAQMILRDESL